MKMIPLLLLLLLGMQVLEIPTVGASVKGGYWLGGESLANINFNFQTHVFYAFAGLDPTTYQLVAPNVSDDNGQIATFVVAAKSSNPAVVPLLSIGGAAAPFATFGEMVETSARRKVFVDSSIALAREYGFEGLDLDWESPQTQREMEHLGTLLKEWRAATVVEALESGKTELLLTAAVSYQSIQTSTGDMNQTWPIDAFNDYLDWANVMNYDYHGSWEPTITGEPTALYDPSSIISTDYGISNWLQAGLHKDKLALGLAYYGKEWNLTSLNDTGIGAPATSGGDPIFYKDIVVYNEGGATIVEDATTVSMYSYKPDLTWIGYDNPDTIAAKVRYAKSRDLLGFFAWALHHDTSNWSLASAASNAWD